MQAKYFFNDTFEIDGFTFDDSEVAWPTDVEGFENVPQYPSGSNISWLYERYPMIGETEGVKNAHFVSWIRAEALDYVRKPYGTLHQKLEKGQQLTIRINASFPTDTLDASKEFVITSYNSMGERYDLFGVFLLVCGSVCVAGALGVLLTKWLCPRSPGEKRQSWCHKNG